MEVEATAIAMAISVYFADLLFKSPYLRLIASRIRSLLHLMYQMRTLRWLWVFVMAQCCHFASHNHLTTPSRSAPISLPSISWQHHPMQQFWPQRQSESLQIPPPPSSTRRDFRQRVSIQVFGAQGLSIEWIGCSERTPFGLGKHYLFFYCVLLIASIHSFIAFIIICTIVCTIVNYYNYNLFYTGNDQFHQ